MLISKLVAAALALGLSAGPALAIDTAVQLTINLPANAQTTLIRYQCPGHDPFSVQYVNAEPIYLALVPIGSDKRLFVHVLSADGAKYASGQYVWWTKGNSATLIDLTADKTAKPLTCDEVNDIP